jgi:hypothetical protein
MLEFFGTLASNKNDDEEWQEDNEKHLFSFCDAAAGNRIGRYGAEQFCDYGYAGPTWRSQRWHPVGRSERWP